MSIRVRLIFYFVLIVILSINLSRSGYGNGSAWNSGLYGSVPGPTQQHELILEKEHVVMEGPKVSASFWVNNPTDHDIEITMGFPLAGKSYTIKDAYDNPEKRSDSWFNVVVNDTPVPFQINFLDNADYPVVVNWKMNYARHTLTRFLVTYPLIFQTYQADNPGIGGSSEYTYKYITHTGSYWAQPIKQATFEFCGGNARFFINNPSGETIFSKGGWTVDQTSVAFSPRPFTTDKKRGCIVWERKNWKPRKDVDDIEVYKRWIHSSYYAPWMFIDGEEKKSFDSITDQWCGLDQDFSGKQFGSQANLDKDPLSDDKLNKLITDSYVYVTGGVDGCDGEECDSFYSFPEHLATDYQLLLLRYLRNYIYATKGHHFKDRKMAVCYSNVHKVSDTLNQDEKINVNFLQTREDKIKKRNQAAWEKVRANLK